MPNAYNLDTAEDITGQAGWMFSDMLVALMVVFLATISFLPDYALGANSESNSNTVTTGDFTYVEHFDKAFTATYQGLSGNLEGDVAVFLKDNNIPSNAVIDSAQIVGGYNAKKEQAIDGVNRASKFAQQIDKVAPHLLEHASTILNSSPSIPTSSVTLRFTFTSNVTTNR